MESFNLNEAPTHLVLYPQGMFLFCGDSTTRPVYQNRALSDSEVVHLTTIHSANSLEQYVF